jgi:two-component system phosphate regulon sensor histidine kinase PhoR
MTGNLSSSDEASRGLPSSDDLEQTLQRLVRRVAMLMQAEKCVFLLHDRERQLLVARRPALGLTPEELRILKVPVDSGLSGDAFQSGEPVVVEDTKQLQPIDQKWANRLEAHNLIVYPLIIERPDEQARTADRLAVGVLHVINKRGAAQFSQDDVRLLSVMARQVAAVIADAQIYLRLTEEKEQLQATFQSVLAAMVMVDSSGHISLLNPAACQMFRIDDHEANGRRYEEVFTDESIRTLFRDAIEDNLQAQREIEIVTSDDAFDASQPRIFQAQTAFVHGERDGMPVVMGAVAIFNDITEIRNVERMKTAFVSTVSHELRTPLTSIKGFISTLLQDTEGYFGQEERTEFYQIIDSECDRLRRLIEDLLNVSRIESGRALQMYYTTFDPAAATQSVLQSQRFYTDKHPLKLEVEGEIPLVTGDSDKFDQILTNLVSNAIKYSPSGGEVTVRMSADDMWLHVSVSDQGIGIPADKLVRVFEKFERIDNRDTRQAGGTGIGLFLVKHLVELHGGTILVESEIGKGSTFIFEIPLRPSDPPEIQG